jgi:Flp pilus assembly protein TadD
MGQDARVVELLSPLEAELGDDRLYAYVLGTALLRQNDLQKGLAMIDRLFRGGETAVGHLLLGLQHMRRVDSRQAIPELQQTTELNPNLPTVHSLLGVALMNANDRPAAMAAFRRELKANPNDFRPTSGWGSSSGTRTARRSVRLPCPSGTAAAEDPDVMYGVARIQMGRDDWAAAQKTLEELTASTPAFEGGHVLLATVYYRSGHKEDGDRERAIVEKLKAERRQKELAEEGEASGEARP